MARILTLHDADELSMAIAKTVCCSFLLQILDDYVFSEGCDFAPEVLDESRAAVLDWQLLEIRKIEEIHRRIEVNHNNGKSVSSTEGREKL